MSWLDGENTIHGATVRVCLALQDEARDAYFNVGRYMHMELLGRACQEQRNAAQAHREMYDRLERLIGAA